MSPCRVSPTWRHILSSMSCPSTRCDHLCFPCAHAFPCQHGRSYCTMILMHVLFHLRRFLPRMQPYVCIGALTTRARPESGIKDSHQNVTDTK